MTSRQGCMVCGPALLYGAAGQRTCTLCGCAMAAEPACATGHFVCDACHGAPASDVIAALCSGSAEADPVRLAQAILHCPAPQNCPRRISQ